MSYEIDLGTDTLQQSVLRFLIQRPFLIQRFCEFKNRLKNVRNCFGALVQTLGMRAQTFRKLRRITYWLVLGVIEWCNTFSIQRGKTRQRRNSVSMPRNASNYTWNDLATRKLESKRSDKIARDVPKNKRCLLVFFRQADKPPRVSLSEIDISTGAAYWMLLHLVFS